MSFFKANSDFSSIKTIEELVQYLSPFARELTSTVNGKIEFGINIPTNQVTVSFPVVNAEVAIPHGLGRIPKGYITVSNSNFGVTWNSGKAWTDQFIYLVNTQISVCEIFLY